jgi:hypothetical protein
VDAAGEVVELTWTFVGSVYFGTSSFRPMAASSESAKRSDVN